MKDTSKYTNHKCQINGQILDFDQSSQENKNPNPERLKYLGFGDFYTVKCNGFTHSQSGTAHFFAYLSVEEQLKIIEAKYEATKKINQITFENICDKAMGLSKENLKSLIFKCERRIEDIDMVARNRKS